MSGADGHLHAWETIATALPAGPPADLAAGLPRLRAEMDDAGIGRGLLVQPSHRGLDHGYLLDAAAADPARFKVVVLGVPSDGRALQELGSLCRHPAVIGIRLVPLRSPERDWFGSGSDGLWELARARRLTVFVLASPPQLIALLPALDRYADVPVVIDHLGRPDLDTAGTWESSLTDLAARANVSLKVSALGGLTAGAVPFPETWGWVARTVKAFGPLRLMWGSDFPYLGRARSLAEARSAGPLCLEAAGLSAADVATVMDRNTRHRFWGAHDRPAAGAR